MPQLVDNMKIIVLMNIGSKLKVNIIKLRHAPYSNRYREIKNKIPDNKFKELMSVNSDDAKIRFLVNQDKNGKIKEFLMFVNSDGESLVMSLTGDMDMKTISEIGNAVNVPGINNLGGLVK
jgi:hypothetical protein